MDELIDKYFQVHDYGFVALKDVMGSDESIVQAARVSYGKGTKTTSDDKGLIRNLMRHRHTSPFEMVEFKFHFGMPIFVARQWIRHRTASVNEYSGRYSEMPCIFYKPKKWKAQSKTNKQGSGDGEVGTPEWDNVHPLGFQGYVNDEIDRKHLNDKVFYGLLLENGVSKELSRIELPLSIYTYKYWKIDLHNLLHFLELRLDRHAQEQIRDYAKIIAGIVKKCCPITWEAFEDYRLNSVTFTKAEMNAIKQISFAGLWPSRPEERSITESHESMKNFTKTEKREFWEKIDLQETKGFDLDLSQAKTAEYFENIIRNEGKTDGIQAS